LAFSAALCSLGSALFASSEVIIWAQVGRFLIGAGSACAFISCLQLASSLFSPKFFPIIAGATNMMGTLGGLFGEVPVAKLVNVVGWQSTIYYLSVIGLVVTALILIVVPRRINGKHCESKNVSIASAFKRIITNRQVILSGIISGFMYLPISAFSELWAVPFFMKKYDITNDAASVASAILFVGVSMGSIVCALVARTLQSYTKTIKISIIYIVFLFVPLVLCDVGLYTSFILVFLVGFATGAQVLTFACAKNSVSAELTGTTLAVTNALVMFVGAIFQPVLGVLLDFFWSGQYDDKGIRLYEISCFQKTLLVLPLFLLVALVLSFFIKETMPLEPKSDVNSR
jgi:MFS family permease